MINRNLLRMSLLAGASLFAATTAAAQDIPAQNAPPAEAAAEEEIVVVGSQIRGSQVTDILPVTVLEAEDIDAVAATGGDDLLRAVPQAGDVSFNESRDAGGSNDARGDTASINLRSLGTGNTLVLLNGRRLVLHPGTQVENLVPVQSVNSNAIPAKGVKRLEILRDGAAAIYGTDAVAGVVNTVLKSRFDGLTVEAEGTITGRSDQEEFDVSFEAGKTFSGGRTNFSLFGQYNQRDALYARERSRSRNSDLRSQVAGTPFETESDFDNRATDTIWAEFQRLNPTTFAAATTATSYNGTALTTSGLFHVQPLTNEGCVAPGQTADTCFDNSTLATAGADSNLKYNTNADRTVQGANKRLNLFGYINHEFSDSLEFFGEIGYYRADYSSQREQETTLANQRVIIGPNAYWNPLGATGTTQRLAGLTGVVTAGVPLELLDYRPVDTGALTVDVENVTTRYLAGLRGTFGGWDWESAAVYSRANTRDTMRTISLTRFEQALNRTDATAYNPFNGGDPLNPESRDSSPTNPDTIRSFMVDVTRENTTTLAMWDFKLSRPDLISLPGGNLGVASGVEYRRETYRDNRDPRLDGTIAFTAMDGTGNGSDIMGASPTPDSSGRRNVASAFAELAIPVISPSMDIPFVHRLSLQLAGRYEHYTSFGSVAKPKVAGSWFMTPWLQLRTAWSQGFRAPGLPQQFERGIQRSNSRKDYIQCEALIRNGTVANLNACTNQSFGTVSNRSGSESLQPEESDNFTIGTTVNAPIPRSLGKLTLTADYWEIRQKNLIGLFGDGNALILDYYLRMNGSSNPNVERAAPTATQIANFAGSGLDPAGRVIQVIDNYRNLGPRVVRGYDLGLFYSIKDTPLGNWSFKVNAARTLEFYQTPDSQKAMLIAAQAEGKLDVSIPISGAESLIEQDGRPKWRITGTINWSSGDYGVGYFTSYTGGVDDTGASLADGTLWRVDDYMTHNLYGQVMMGKTRLRIGVRNLLDKEAPLSDNPYGYNGDLYSNKGRSFYASLRHKF